MISDLVYKACYWTAYGVVYPGALLLHVVPKDNVVAQGLYDGSMDAIHAIRSRRGGVLVEPVTIGPTVCRVGTADAELREVMEARLDEASSAPLSEENLG